MKNTRYLFVMLTFCIMMSSCTVWNKAFPPKYGCGTNGKNVGAEKLLDEDQKTPKARKFKA